MNMIKKDSYICIRRDVLTNMVRDLRGQAVAFRLLLDANFGDTWQLKRGQLRISQRSYAKHLGMCRDTLRRYLKSLSELGFIQSKPSQNLTTITLVHYDMLVSQRLSGLESRPLRYDSSSPPASEVQKNQATGAEEVGHGCRESRPQWQKTSALSEEERKKKEEKSENSYTTFEGEEQKPSSYTPPLSVLEKSKMIRSDEERSELRGLFEHFLRSYADHVGTCYPRMYKASDRFHMIDIVKSVGFDDARELIKVYFKWGEEDGWAKKKGFDVATLAKNLPAVVQYRRHPVRTIQV